MKDKWKYREVHVSEIVHTAVNANEMDKKTFEALVRNVRQSGLSSVICCYQRKSDKKYVLISGNHRYDAAIEVGYTKLGILFTEEENLTHDEIIALQLSHNSIHGEANPMVLRRLFDEIEAIDFKEFAFISIDEIDTADTFTSSIVPLQQHFNIGLVLYSSDMEKLKDLLGVIDAELDRSDLIILAGGENEKKLLQRMGEIKNKYRIKSSSVAFSKLIELSYENITNHTQ